VVSSQHWATEAAVGIRRRRTRRLGHGDGLPTERLGLVGLPEHSSGFVFRFAISVRFISSWLFELAVTAALRGWVGDASYPRCPDCDQLAPFVGQLEVASGGRFYSFFCARCSIAMTLYQQT
jgi:hypothetical protein